MHEVPQGAKVNSEQCITLLSERYPPELRAWYADDTDIHWQQDEAPCHQSKKTMSYLNGADWRKRALAEAIQEQKKKQQKKTCIYQQRAPPHFQALPEDLLS